MLAHLRQVLMQCKECICLYVILCNLILVKQYSPHTACTHMIISLTLTIIAKIRKFSLMIEKLRNRASMISGSITIHITAKNISQPAPDSYKPASSYSDPASLAASSISLIFANAIAAQISIIKAKTCI